MTEIPRYLLVRINLAAPGCDEEKQQYALTAFGGDDGPRLFTKEDLPEETPIHPQEEALSAAMLSPMNAVAIPVDTLTDDMRRMCGLV